MRNKVLQQYLTAVLEVFGKLPLSDVKYKIDERTKEQYRKSLLASCLYASDEFLAQNQLTKGTVELSKSVLGRDLQQFNETAFYMSFEQTMSKSAREHIWDQLLHYMGTYGREHFGLEPVLIVPVKETAWEELAIDDIKLKKLETITGEEIEAGCAKMVSSGVALSEKTQENVLTIAKYLHLDWDVDMIANKEFKMRWYSAMGKVPTAPEEFLRYIIFRQCNTTLLVRNAVTIRSLRSAFMQQHKTVAPLFKQYIELHGEKPLASIFLRNKVLFLALKREPEMKPIINKLRKLAVKYHKPMQMKPLDKLTSSDALTEEDLSAIKAELDKVTIFKRIVALNTCRLYASNPQKLVYKIRNGKSFVKESGRERHIDERVEQIIWDSIKEYLGDKFTGQEFYLPSEVQYAVPTSEKDMLGAIPFGSILDVPLNAIVGIHWFDIASQRVDLDLSLTNKDVCFNWTNWHGSNKEQPVYSGDMTSAPVEEGGASEAFYIPEKYKHNLMLSVNFYNAYFDANETVPFKIFIGGADSADSVLKKKCLLSAEETALAVPSEITKGQLSLGIIEAGENKRSLIIGATSFSDNNVMDSSEVMTNAMEAILHRYHTNVTLRELIERCGGKVVTEMGENTVDLSPENISKEQMLDMLAPVDNILAA